MSAPIEVVRGMRDTLPADRQNLLWTQAQIEAVLTNYGYTQIDLPIIEQRDLYLRKLGEELVGKVYEFTFGGRNLALRPEWTASVLRAYVAHLQDQPLPLRLSYSGPVFRYERPQRHTYRQFTQIGVEIIGSAGPRADAEVLALACAGLEATGIHDYTIVLGHIGLVRNLLSRFDLAERTQGRLVWELERLRTQGIDVVRTRLQEARGELPIDPTLLERMDDAQASELLLKLLPTVQVDLAFGTRSPEEIVGRLLRKLRRGDQQPQVERALDLVHRLSQIRGAPAETLPQAAALLSETGADTTTLDEVRAILALLEAHNVSRDRIVLDFGMGRGLHYYTGMIFEMYDADDMQLCGGGRYDDLVSALGGRQPAPAVGFAYGLERVSAALPSGRSPIVATRSEVLIVPVEDEDYPYALEVARRLRTHDVIATTDVRGRTVTNNLRDAARRGVAYAAIVGAEERERGEVVWRNLNDRIERRIKLDEIATVVASHEHTGAQK